MFNYVILYDHIDSKIIIYWETKKPWLVDIWKQIQIEQDGQLAKYCWIILLLKVL